VDSRAGSLAAMTQLSPAPQTDVSLVRGTAIAALIYQGAIFLAAMAVALTYGPIIFIFGGAALSMEGYSSQAMTDAGIFFLVCIAAFVLTTAPFVLAVCMFIAARRNDIRQMKVVLVLFTLVSALTPIGMVALIATAHHIPAAALLATIPEWAIVVLGWTGWTRMRHPSAPVADQSPQQMPQPAPGVLAQHPEPVPHHGQSQTLPTDLAVAGTGVTRSPWQAPGRMG